MTNISRPSQTYYHIMVEDATLEVLARPAQEDKGGCEFFSCQRDSNKAIAISHSGHPVNKDEPEGNCFMKNCPTAAYSNAKTVAMREIAEVANSDSFTSLLGTIPEGEVEQAAVAQLDEVSWQEIVGNMEEAAQAADPSLHALIDDGEHALIDGVMAVADSVAGHVLLQAPSLYSTLCAAQAYAENAIAKYEIREARAKRLVPPPTIWPYSADSWKSVATSDNGARTQDVCFAIGFLLAGLVIARRASFAHAAQGEQAEAASVD